MVEAIALPDLESKLDRITRNTRQAGDDGGGRGSSDGDVGQRVASLERAFEKLERTVEKMDGKLDRLIDSVAELRGRLDTKTEAVDLAAVRGRVEALPTTWQLITLVLGIFVGAFAILKYGLPLAP